MQPNKVSGLTQHQRTRMCLGKRRWSDELTAVAGAIHVLEIEPNLTRLFVYRCPNCCGWHLTRRPQPNQQPITRGSVA